MMRIATIGNGTISWNGERIATVTKFGLAWDEHSHPRKNDGTFTTKGSGGSRKSDAWAFALRDEAVPPSWKDGGLGIRSTAFRVGPPEGGHDYEVYYSPSHVRFKQKTRVYQQKYIDALVKDIHELEPQLGEIRIGEVSFSQIVGRSHRTSLTKTGHAREVFRHVIGAVENLCDQGEGAIVFTGATPAHDKLYAYLMAAEGKVRPDYRPLRLGFPGYMHVFVLARKDVADAIEQRHAGKQLNPKKPLNVQRFAMDRAPEKYAADWDESLHPRDDDGKFVEKGQDGAKGSKGAKLAVRPAKIDPAKLSKAVLQRMHKHLNAQGYDVRGTEDVRKILASDRVLRDGVFTHEDWQAAYEKATAGDEAQRAKAEVKKTATSHVNWAAIKQRARMNYSPQAWKMAGYMAPDGKLLNYAGGGNDFRTDDHRDEMGTAGMQELMAAGYIRCMPEAGGLDMSAPPTPAQRSVIRKVIEDLNGEVVVDAERGLGTWDERNEWYYGNSDEKFYREYDAGTKASRVLADLDRYYAGGTQFSVRGEYWIQDGRGVEADSDTGMGHADHVVDMLFEEAGDILGEDEHTLRDWQAEVMTATKNDAYRKLTVDGPRWAKLAAAGWTLEKLDGMLGTSFSPREVDPRYIGMQEYGWHRVEGRNITTHRVTKGALKDIADGLYDIHGDEVEDEKFNLEDATTNAFYAGVPFTVLAEENPAKLREYRTNFAVRGDQTKTPEFKAWFGNSKVVDKQGQPLVVYHGTPSAGFSQFDSKKTGETTQNDGWFGRGHYFTADPNKASGYAHGEGGGLYPVHLSLQKPFVINKTLDAATRKAILGLGRWGEYGEMLLKDSRYDGMPTGDFIAELFPDTDQMPDGDYDDEDADYYIPGTGEAFRDMLWKHDGVIVHDGRDKFDEVVAFNPTQIKSATGNRGTFDPKNPDIRFAARGQKVDVSHLHADGREGHEGPVFKTGQAVTFHFLRNPKSATGIFGKPKPGDRYDRDKEPSGEYMVSTSGHLDGYEGMLQGQKTFQNPLVIKAGGGYGDPTNWKHELSKAFGGLTGKRLSKAIIAAGHDGIVTVNSKYDIGEILDLTTFDEKKARFAVRQKQPPQKTIKAYKQFRTLKSHPGKLFPLFIGKTDHAPLGQWLDAEHIPTKGYASRPGWHAGELPLAPHLRSKQNRIQEGRVWAEVEMPADRQWQHVADSQPTKDIRDQVPHDGHYRFKTNKMQGGAWLVGGSLKVNRILQDDDVRQILLAAGIKPDEVDRELSGMPVQRTPVKHAARQDFLRGGKADRIPARAFDPQQLTLGTIIEMEHTHNVRLAQEIARDHLAENPNYYRLLSRFVEQPTMRPMGDNPLVGWGRPGLFAMRKRPGADRQSYAAGHEQPRSPKPHGVTISGQYYPPGQWIPGDQMQNATAGQRKAIETGDSRHATAEEPVPDTSHLGFTPQQLLEHLQHQGLMRHAALSYGHGGVVAEVDGRQITIRVAQPGELERFWREDQVSARESMQAGGFDAVAAIAGAYRDGQIVLAPDFSLGEMNHELIHGLRDLGIIRQEDVDLFGGEEQLAYAYQRWIDKPTPHALFERIGDFFKALLGSDVAKRRQTLRRFDRGNFSRPVNWGKVSHRAVLLGLAANSIRKQLPEIKARRESVADMLNQAAYGGAYQPSDGVIMHGSVDPNVVESGIRDDGVIAAGAILFSTRDWRTWMDNFEAKWKSDPVLQARYTPRDVAELRKGMEATAAIFGDFSQLDPELTDTFEQGVDKRGRPFVKRVPGPSPLRSNSDPLFKETFDVTTVCPKQDLFVAVCNQVQRLTNTIFGKQARNLINATINALGAKGGGGEAFSGYCEYCYGQGSRNNAAQGCKAVAEQIWPAWQKLAQTERGQRVLGMRPTAAAKQAAMKKVFQQELGRFYWYNKKEKQFSQLYQAFEQFGDDPGVHDLMSRPPDVHDIVMGQYKGPQLTSSQAQFMELVRGAIQGGLKPNIPKGWASYTDQLLSRSAGQRVAEYNRSAGFRMNSQSDFRPWHVLEVEQFLTHLRAQGGMAHVYTRKPEFVDIFGRTGIKFNLSLGYSHDTNGKVMRDGSGRPIWDMKSFPKDKALGYRKRHPGEVGTMLVATSMDALLSGLDDPEVDMMIPYHAGSVPKAADEYYGYTDFSKFQHEHWGNAHAKGERVTTTINVRGQQKTISLVWGNPITREHHNDDKDQYLALCDNLGIVPRFPQLCGRAAKWHGSARLEHPLRNINIDHPNYMKLVKDVAVTHTPQRVVDPTKIDWNAAERHAQAWMRAGGSEGEKRIPKGLVQLVHDTMTGAEPLPASPVGQDVLSPQR